MQLAILVEGQQGLTWERWQRLARAVEALGFAGLYRSDHFTDLDPPERDALDLWASLTWLADHTTRLELGPLVSPMSFRHPLHTARAAVAVDDLSHGRLKLGLGAGWVEREHEVFGFDLLDIDARFERFAEGLHLIRGLLHSAEPMTFTGRHYRLREARLLPRPQRPGGPPIVIGGNGPRRTLPLAARYADEWNGLFLTPDRFREAGQRLDELLAAAGRPPGAVRRSLLTGCVLGKDAAQVEQRAAVYSRGRRSIEQLRQRARLIGTPAEVIEQFGALAQAGVEGVILQWLDMDDLAGLEELSARVLPRLPA